MTRAVLGTLVGLLVGTLLGFLVLSNRGLDPHKATMITTVVGMTFGIAGALVATRHGIRAFVEGARQEEGTPQEIPSSPSPKR